MRRGRRVGGGGLWIEEYQWTMGKLEEATMWPKEEGAESSMMNSSSQLKRTGWSSFECFDR
jgi:hypothetical protein